MKRECAAPHNNTYGCQIYVFKHSQTYLVCGSYSYCNGCCFCFSVCRLLSSWPPLLLMWLTFPSGPEINAMFAVSPNIRCALFYCEDSNNELRLSSRSLVSFSLQRFVHFLFLGCCCFTPSKLCKRFSSPLFFALFICFSCWTFIFDSDVRIFGRCSSFESTSAVHMSVCMCELCVNVFASRVYYRFVSNII